MISNMNKEYHIAEGVTAFSTTRKGGVSQGNYSEFNINDYCGDCAEHVAENRRKLADELGISIDHIILPHQVHGVEVRQVAGDYFSMPDYLRLAIPRGVLHEFSVVHCLSCFEVLNYILLHRTNH